MDFKEAFYQALGRVLRDEYSQFEALSDASVQTGMNLTPSLSQHHRRIRQLQTLSIQVNLPLEIAYTALLTSIKDPDDRREELVQDYLPGTSHPFAAHSLIFSLLQKKLL